MENQEVKKSKRFKTIDIAYIGIFAALIAVCSWISIPFAVPVTLQTMAVCITAGLLGTKKSVLTVLVYILLGLIGVPVFAGFSSGAGVLFGMTGGYIIGFIFTALIVGIMLKVLGKRFGFMLFQWLSALLSVMLSELHGLLFIIIAMQRL